MDLGIQKARLGDARGQFLGLGETGKDFKFELPLIFTVFMETLDLLLKMRHFHVPEIFY